MRAFAIVILVLLGSFGDKSAAWAEPSNNCKQCSDEQRTCRSNYSATTCKSQYDLCMKSCQKKNSNGKKLDRVFATAACLGDDQINEFKPELPRGPTN